VKHLIEIPVPFREQVRQTRETGFGYHVISVVLKNGTTFEQVAASEGCIIEVRGHEEIPFKEEEVESIKVNHKRWNFRDHSPERKRKVRAAAAKA
jgi:hypothetical protein